MAYSVDPDETPCLWCLIRVYTVCSGLSDQIYAIKYTVTHSKSHAQTGKIMTKSSVITNRLSITMAGLIIDYLFSSDEPALITVPYRTTTIKCKKKKKTVSSHKAPQRTKDTRTTHYHRMVKTIMGSKRILLISNLHSKFKMAMKNWRDTSNEFPQHMFARRNINTFVVEKKMPYLDLCNMIGLYFLVWKEENP